jgi:hypothetical protein
LAIGIGLAPKILVRSPPTKDKTRQKAPPECPSPSWDQHRPQRPPGGGHKKKCSPKTNLYQSLRGEARCTTRLWVFGSLASDWLLALPLQRPHIRLSTVQRNAYYMPCRANHFEPMGMTSEVLGAMLPIPPRDPSPMRKSLRTVPQISLVQKAQNAVPHGQGAFMA